MLKKQIKKPKISVIIPVYNSEKYLFRCLDSLKNQTYKDFEAIIVNSDSKDSSLDIIKQFTQKYENFHLINKDNSGVSDSRNTALKSALGEYISFLDSDDFLSPDFLSVLYNSLIENDADIACCGYYTYYPKSQKAATKKLTAKNGVYSSKKALNMLIKDTTMHFYVWNKLFKRSLFEDNNISFPNMLFEDIYVTTRLFYYAKKVSMVHKPYYYYVVHGDSLVNCINKKMINEYAKAIVLLRNFLEEKKIYKDFKLSLKLFAIRGMLINIKFIFFLHSNEKSFASFFSNIHKSNKIILYSISKNFNIYDNIYDIPNVLK